MTLPTFDLEYAALKEGCNIICGVDEAGRGPWAGPVVASAVILNEHALPRGLNDSKRLSAAKRTRLFDEIRICAQVGVGLATVEEIDRLNILQASLLAMSRAVQSLETTPDLALVDGNQPPRLSCPCHTLVKGDARSLSIAAASIIAKVTRDRMMEALALEHPVYAWEKNKGYGTADHQHALEAFGITQHHRRSFKPIHNILCRNRGYQALR